MKLYHLSKLFFLWFSSIFNTEERYLKTLSSMQSIKNETKHHRKESGEGWFPVKLLLSKHLNPNSPSFSH